MKKILLFMLIIAIILIAGIGIYIATFDIDHYRPIIITKLEELTGSDVVIGDMTLKWTGRLALSIEGLELHEKGAVKDEPEMSLEKGDLTVDLFKLLKGQVSIGTLSLVRPRIRVLRKPPREIVIEGYDPEPVETTDETVVITPVSLDVNSFSINDGHVYLNDSTIKPPLGLDIDHIDVNVRDLSFEDPVRFDSGMAVFADNQNIRINGIVSGLKEKDLRVSDLNVSVDLGMTKYDLLARSFPQMSNAGFGDDLSGELDIKVNGLLVGPSGIESMDAAITLADAAITLNAPDIAVSKLDVVLDNISITGPAKLDAGMAFFSFDKNIHVSGDISGIFENNPVVKELKADIDLSRIDTGEVIKAFPEIKKIGLTGDIEGALDIYIKRAALGAMNAGDIEASASLSKGKMFLRNIYAPIEDISFSASTKNGNIQIKDLSAIIAGAMLQVSGKINGISTSQDLDMEVGIQIPKLSSFIDEAYRTEARLDGKIDFYFEGSSRGMEWGDISRTLTGRGGFSLEDGVLVNVNVLRQVIDKLSGLPRLGQTLYNNLPDNLRYKLREEHTLLRPIKKTFTIESGNIYINDLRIETDTMGIYSNMVIGLDGNANGNGIVIFGPSLTDALLRSMNELSVLLNRDNMIQFPIKYSFINGRFSINPDVEYITQQIVRMKGQELVSGLFDNSSGSGSGGQGGLSPFQSGQNSTAANAEQLIGELLRNFK